MRHPGILFLTACWAAGPALAADEPRSAAAVIAADDQWLQAEIRGDADFLDALLLPGYRSIGAKGEISDKRHLVDGARRRGASPAMAETVRAWKAAHPTHADVQIIGDTAVLTWVLDKSDGSAPVSSCDIFVYRDGRWRAIYSQHSLASG